MNKSWQDELRDKFEGANDLSSSNGIDGLIAFIQDLLDRKAREIEGLIYIDGTPGYNQGLLDALNILKEEEHESL